MDIADRFNANPILVPGDLKPSHSGLEVECLLNPGVFRFRGKTWLLVRVAERPRQEEGTISFPVYAGDQELEILSFPKDSPEIDASDPRVITYQGKYYLTTLSHLRLFRSTDGIHFEEPAGYKPLFGQGEQERFGIEDCRVTEMEDGYHLTYTKVSSDAVGVGYMFTRDWQNYERRGMIFPPHNKDSVFFDEKINGYYYALHRPSSPELGGNYIWIAQSPDRLHWGNHRLLARTREDHWDSVRVGAGAAPIKTEEGWLEIYHGADAQNRYCLGALLLDREDPSRVIARSREPVMEPLAPYEKTGFFGNVVFTNGHTVEGDRLTIYYGSSDEVVCGATFSIRQILNSLIGN